MASRQHLQLAMGHHQVHDAGGRQRFRRTRQYLHWMVLAEVLVAYDLD